MLCYIDWEKIIDMRRNHSIDILKGVCIIFVIVTHFASSEETLRFLFPLWIVMAVPFFMIISGYVYAGSYIRNDIKSLSDAYRPKFLIDKMIRYTIPYTVAWVIEFLWFWFFDDRVLGWKAFLVGGYGPGGFYYPIMMQFIFTFPVIFFIIKKYDFYGLLLCGAANCLYEILRYAYGMNGECYRLLIFRYILVIAFGCYLSLRTRRVKKIWGYVSFIVGLLYIILISYTAYSPKIITYWTGTSFVSCLYVLPIAALLIDKCKVKLKALELIGKASYNIFLVQMIYYSFLAGMIYSFVSSRILELAADISICVLIGIIFYYVETPITKIILTKVNYYVSKWEQSNIISKMNIFYDD